PNWLACHWRTFLERLTADQPDRVIVVKVFPCELTPPLRGIRRIADCSDDQTSGEQIQRLARDLSQWAADAEAAADLMKRSVQEMFARLEELARGRGPVREAINRSREELQPVDSR